MASPVRGTSTPETMWSIVERVRWPDAESLPPEPGPTPAVLARTFTYLYGAGGLLALTTVFLPHAPDRWTLGVLLPAVAALLIAVLTTVSADRLPTVFFRGLPMIGTVLASELMLAGNAASMIPYAAFYFWVVLSSFYLFDARWAWLNVALVGFALALVLWVSPDVRDRTLTWVMLMGALSVAGAVIGLLRSRLEGVAEQSHRALQQSLRTEDSLKRTLRRLRATIDISLAMGRYRDPRYLLGLIAEHAQALLDARGVSIWLSDADDDRPAAVAGELRVPAALFPQRGDLRVPLSYQGTTYGVLVALPPLGSPGYSNEDAEMLRAFASNAATAVAGARMVQEDVLRRSIDAAERERRRFARELHDETLQTLAALAMMLEAAGDDEELLLRVRDTAVQRLREEVSDLRRIIADLRPSPLDELGLGSALHALIERFRNEHGLAVDAGIDLPSLDLDPAAEQAIYRVVQEGLTNVFKHAGARSTRVLVRVQGDRIIVRVTDDGCGFDILNAEGFGLVGMRERLALVGATLHVESGRYGTTLDARVPVAALSPRRASSAREGARQAPRSAAQSA